jgi:hypothetical protein
MAGLMIEYLLKMKKFKSNYFASFSAPKQSSPAKSLVGAAVIAAGVFGAGMQAYGAPNTPNLKGKSQITILLPTTLKPVGVSESAGQEESRIAFPVSNPIKNDLLNGLKPPTQPTSVINIDYANIITFLLSSLQNSVFDPLLNKSAIITIALPNDRGENLITPEQPQGPITPSPQDSTLEARDAAAVPGPLPLLGLASAFGCSRRLRQRISNRSQN